MISVNPHPYYFLKINNYDNIKDYFVKNAFAKLLKTVIKIVIYLKDKGISQQRIKYLQASENLSRLEVQVVDYRDRIINFNGVDFSFTLEIGHIYDKKLYEEILSNGIIGDDRLKYFI